MEQAKRAPEPEQQPDRPAPVNGSALVAAPSAARLLRLQQTAGNRAVGRVLARRSPGEVIAEHAGWIDQADLGAELRRRALDGELELVGQVLDQLSWFNRHNAALAFAGPGCEPELERLAATAAGRAVMDRVLDELSRLWGGAAETAAAERVMRARSARLSPETVERGLHAAKIFPFRLPGITVPNDAQIRAERRPGNRVWVSLPPRVSGTYPDEAADLPWAVFGPGIELPEDELVGVRMYDLGGEVLYRPAIFLVQLSNQKDAQTLESMATTAGLALGGMGSAAEAGAGLTARLLVAADRIATGVGVVATVVREHRGWIVARFGERGRTLLRHVDMVNSVVAVYGGIRALAEMGRLVLGLRRAILDWRAAAAAAEAGLPADERAVVAEITREADAVVGEIDAAAPRAADELDGSAGVPRRSAPVPVSALVPRETRQQLVEFFVGPVKSPRLAEIEPILDRVWSELGGSPTQLPRIQTAPLKKGTEGWFASWLGEFGTICVASRPRSAGRVVNTVHHEAMHARLSGLLPWTRQGTAEYSPVAATLFAHFDEILSYAYGGYGQIKDGPMMIDRLEGLLDVTLAPWLAYGSMNNIWEAIPLLVRDAVLLIMLAIGILAIAVAAGATALLACFGVSTLAPEPSKP